MDSGQNKIREVIMKNEAFDDLTDLYVPLERYCRNLNYR